MTNISIIGSGIVGTSIGKGFKEFGNRVIFFDISKNRVDCLNRQGLFATTDLESIAKDSEIFFICVPTPDKNQDIDLSMIKKAISDLARMWCNTRKDYFLVVIKSSIIPTTTERIIIPLIEKFSEKKIGPDIGICFNPEFLRDGHAYADFMNPDRIVIGEYDKKSGDILEKLYSTFKCPILRTDLKTAEMAKYANNCFYATKISFFNEIHIMCQKIGIDSNFIRKVVQLDRFYGTHPWEHGHSFGGKCLPKDLNAIIAMYNEGHIYNPILLKAVRDVNENLSEGNTSDCNNEDQKEKNKKEEEV